MTRRGPSSKRSAPRADRPRSERHRPGRSRAGPRPRRPRVPLDRAALAIVALAAVLRLWGIADRLPDATLGINVLEDTAVEETDRTTMGRSWTMWGGGTKRLDLNPHTGGWPALSFYLTLLIQAVYRAWFSLTHAGAGAPAFASHIAAGDGAREMFVLARLVGAAIGVASVALTLRLGTRLAGRAVGLGAALLLAVNLPHIQVSQHVSDPNLLALFFVLLAAFPMVRIAEGIGTTRDSILAGALLGLAGACKYVPLVLVVPLIAAHPGGLKNRAAWLAGAAAAAALVAATPFTFLDWKTTLRDLRAQRNSLFSNWIGQSEFPISLPTYLIEALPHALGWIGYALALGGLVALWRLGRPGRLLVAVVAAIVLVNGMLKAAQERYVLVAMPPLCIAAAIGFARARAWWSARRLPALAPAILAAAAVLWPLPELARTRAALRLPDTRHIARWWIVANVPASDLMAVELYGPVFPDGERAFVIWPFFATQAPLVRPAYHPEFLDGIRYLSQSHGISGRFEADSAHYPAEVAYYRWIRRNARLLWSTSGQRSSGPTIDVRELPRTISTRSRRDSLFQALVPEPTGTTRLALWAADLSTQFAQSGRPDRAEEWALRGLRIGARNMTERLYRNLAMARMQMGNPAGAEEAARAGIEFAPRSSGAHLYRGLALQALGRLDEAYEEMRTAHALSGDPRIHLNLGELLAAMGRYEEAARELEQVPEGARERGPARRNLAILYVNHLGQRERGIAAMAEAIALEPDPEQARQMREDLERVRRATSRTP